MRPNVNPVPAALPAWYHALQPYLPLLVSAAGAGFSPVNAAGAIADYLETLDAGHPAWSLLAREPVEIDAELAAVVPQWAGLPMDRRRQWLAELRASISELFSADDEGSEDGAANGQ